ncbi:MAG: phosphate ABC transporter permease subunit PstC [Clostridia bacterium]|nr:phosphate ABC transporter permease subunit PstC [Clostridia bacterium]
MMTNTKVKEKIGKSAFTAAAVLCIIAVAAIFVFLIVKSLPAFKKIGFFDFLLGDNWSPDKGDTYAGESLAGSYGIFTMIVGTLAATVGALLLGGVFGYFTAVFLAYFCPRRLKRVFSSVINLLAGIPSVVYGFFGIVFLLSKLSVIAPNNGSGLLATSIILGIMILPTVVSLSRTSLEAVPRSYYEGAVALGATHTQAVFKTCVPAAKSGITASLVLGVGRALGETMAVVMVAGNSPTYPNSLFNSFRVMTANIVMEMGYAGEVQEGALVATGVVLLLFVLVVNLLFSLVSKKTVRAAVKPKNKTVVRKKTFHGVARLRDRFGNIAYKLKTSYIGRAFAIGAGVLSGGILVLVIGFIFAQGLPHLLKNPKILYGKFEFGSENITIFPSIVSTLMAVGLSLLIAIPIGVMTAIFLNEYARKENIFIRIVRSAIDILSGVPSIVYGLFGMIAFVGLLGGKSSILAGSLTISIMLLPTVVRSTEESLKSVADSLREGSLALGAGKMRTIFKVVLPSALPGILSAIILSIGRVISESAPFMYTMGSVITATPSSYLDSGATLAVALYRLAGEGWYMQEAYATAVVLIALVLGLNLFAEWIGGRLRKKLKGTEQ